MKKLNRYFAVILTGLITLSCVACGQATQTAVPESEAQAGMPNPMVEVTDASAFEDQLGITINPQDMSDEAKLFIIDNQIAQIEYTLLGVDGDDVYVTLRASKEQKDISGIIDEDMDITDLDYEGLPMVNKYSDSTNTTIYEFSKDGVNYSLVIQGVVSQMTIGEVLDSTFIACGLM